MRHEPGSCLGWIKPDDGVRGLDYECFRLNEWLRAQGVTGVRVVVEPSHAENGHGLDLLRHTGDIRRLLPPARRLVEAGAGALCWACTSGSFVGGLPWAQEQTQVLAAAACVPATSASLSLVAAIQHLGASRVDLLSPYPEELTEMLRAFLGACGISVRSLRALDCKTGSDSHRLDLHRALAGFAEAGLRGGVPLVIPDSAVNTLHCLAAVEAELGRPVITANQATLWQGLRLLHLAPQIAGGGRLLSGKAVTR